MAFDFKKEFKDLYVPGKKPARIVVPPMQYVAVDGHGNPNLEGGEYQQSLAVLYAISFTIRMSPKSGWEVNGYYEYVVPPLEGLWRQRGSSSFDPARKDDLEFTSMIRLPEFVTVDVFEEARRRAAKKTDTSKAYFFSYDEGECVQALHVGPYDSEPETMQKMEEAETEWNLMTDLTGKRRHHEIYLSDPRRVSPERLRTVLRTPVKPAPQTS